MSLNGVRALGRAAHEVRPLKISSPAFGYAPGSVLIELGNTKVLCSVSLQAGVPPFLKGSKRGWLTAEYAMLPASSQQRVPREGAAGRRNDRAVEISRLIGRCLRAVVDLTTIGERTIMVDCDVLQADGSTRTASITGAFVALRLAVDHWIKNGQIPSMIIKDDIVALSAGFAQGGVLLDLDYAEDNMIDADYTIVLTRAGNIIELQGSAEKGSVSWQELDLMREAVLVASEHLFAIVDACLQQSNKVDEAAASQSPQPSHVPLFSIKNRIQAAG